MKRIVIKVLESEERTKSRILIPDTAKKTSNGRGYIAVGSSEKNYWKTGKKIALQSLKLAMKVLFAKYAPRTEVKLDGEEYMVLKRK